MRDGADWMAQYGFEPSIYAWQLSACGERGAVDFIGSAMMQRPAPLHPAFARSPSPRSATLRYAVEERSTASRGAVPFLLRPNKAIARYSPQAAYLFSCSQRRGHSIASFVPRTSFMLLPQRGQSIPAGRLTFSTITGVVRPWLKL